MPVQVGPRIRGMVLVRTHDAPDIVAAIDLVVGGDARPEARDFDQNLGAVEVHELVVFGDLVVMPDVVGDGGIDMTLAIREIGNPAPRTWIEVQFLAFLTAVAAALPGKCGALVTEVVCCAACLRKTAVAITQQRPRDDRQPKIEIRKHEQLVPEDVPAIRFSVPAACRCADIELACVWGDGLQQMKDMHAELQLHGVIRFGVDLDVALFPESMPCEAVLRD